MYNFIIQLAPDLGPSTSLKNLSAKKQTGFLVCGQALCYISIKNRDAAADPLSIRAIAIRIAQKIIYLLSSKVY